jgi:hypothetical protein|tara:strand:- start:150 stop:281 length:132 start_codon:yes stop_codon:yes gene_type:complete
MDEVVIAYFSTASIGQTQKDSHRNNSQIDSTRLNAFKKNTSTD